MSYILQRFQIGSSSVSLPRYDPETPIGTGPSVQVGTKGPDGAWFDALGDDLADLDLPYDLSWRGVAVEDSLAALETALAGLRALRGRRGRLYREMADGGVQWCTARVHQIPHTVRTHKQFLRQPVEVLFRVVSSWYGAHHGGGWLIGDPNVYIGDGHAIGEDDLFALTTGANVLTVVNNGDGPVTAIELTIAAGTAALEGIEVACGDAHFTVDGLGDSVQLGCVIDCGAQSVRNDGVDGWQYFELAADHSGEHWLELASGNNTVTITLTGAGTGRTATFDFSDVHE